MLFFVLCDGKLWTVLRRKDFGCRRPFSDILKIKRLFRIIIIHISKQQMDKELNQSLQSYIIRK